MSWHKTNSQSYLSNRSFTKFQQRIILIILPILAVAAPQSYNAPASTYPPAPVPTYLVASPRYAYAYGVADATSGVYLSASENRSG